MLCAYPLVRRKVSLIFIDGNMHIINVSVDRETQNFASLQADAIGMAWEKNISGRILSAFISSISHPPQHAFTYVSYRGHVAE